MLVNFIKLCIIFILIGGGYIIYNKPEIKDQFFPRIPEFASKLPEVKGLSTGKVGSISGQLKSDLDLGFGNLQKQALNIKLGDIVNVYKSTQKIANDFRALQEYVKAQIENIGKNK